MKKSNHCLPSVRKYTNRDEMLYLQNFLNQPLPPLPVPLTADADSEDADPDDVMPMFLPPHLHTMLCHPPQN
jgi:hypothetical protein